VGGLAGASTQYSLDAGHHLPGTERFADVVIGPELKAEKPVDLLDAGGDHDDGHR